MSDVYTKPGTYEYAIYNMFSSNLRAIKGLSSPQRLGSEDFKVPFSFIFGSRDWVKDHDNRAAEALVALKKE